MFVFVDLSWRRGLCAKKSRRGTAIDKKRTGGRRRRERGAGGRERCSGWPRCELCDCAVLKSARASSRQTVPLRALRKEPQSEFVLCFLIENEFEISNEFIWYVYIEADQLVGPVVWLVGHYATEMVPAAYVLSQTLQGPPSGPTGPRSILNNVKPQDVPINDAPVPWLALRSRSHYVERRAWTSVFHMRR